METKQSFGMHDQIILVCRRKDGSIKWKTDTETDPMKSNSIANLGMAQVAGLILTDQEAALDKFDFIGIGESNAAENAAHTDLQTPTKRKTATGTRVQTTVANDTAQLVCTFSSGDTLSGTDSIQEAGVFTLAAAGIMLFRKIFTAKSVNWDDGDTLEVTAKCVMVQGA